MREAVSKCGGDLAGRGDGSWAASGPRPAGDLGLGPRSNREGVHFALRCPLPGSGARSAEPGELAGHTAAAGRVPQAHSRGDLWRLPVGGFPFPLGAAAMGLGHTALGGVSALGGNRGGLLTHLRKFIMETPPRALSGSLFPRVLLRGRALGRASSRAGGRVQITPRGQRGGPVAQNWRRGEGELASGRQCHLVAGLRSRRQLMAFPSLSAFARISRWGP